MISVPVGPFKHHYEGYMKFNNFINQTIPLLLRFNTEEENYKMSLKDKIQGILWRQGLDKDKSIIIHKINGIYLFDEGIDHFKEIITPNEWEEPKIDFNELGNLTKRNWIRQQFLKQNTLAYKTKKQDKNKLEGQLIEVYYNRPNSSEYQHSPLDHHKIIGNWQLQKTQ